MRPPLVWEGDRVFFKGQLVSEDRVSNQGVETRYIQSDQVGSTSYVSNEKGALIAQTKDLPFGERWASENQGSQAFIRFAGHEDGPGDAVYMQARMYLPAYGRFASPDPAYDQNAGDSQSWNLYAYVRNNPITSTDPMGMFELPEWAQKISSLAAFGKWQTFEQNAKNVVHSQTAIGPDGRRQIDTTWGLNVNGEYIKQYDHRAIQDDSGSLLVLAGAAKLTGSLARVGTEALTKEAGAAAAKTAGGELEGLSSQAARGIRSLEKRIAEHEAKLGEFKSNPTVRPGMENLSKEQIAAQQARRVLHLEKEIQTFKENIQKLKSGE